MCHGCRHCVVGAEVQRLLLLGAGPVCIAVAQIAIVITWLAFFLVHASSPLLPLGAEGWMVRHCALLGLGRVSRICRALVVKDGFSSAAWSKLLERNLSEQEPQVLEAYKIQQVSSVMAEKTHTHTHTAVDHF